MRMLNDGSKVASWLRYPQPSGIQADARQYRSDVFFQQVPGGAALTGLQRLCYLVMLEQIQFDLLGSIDGCGS
jgi:hypothetical protein